MKKFEKGMSVCKKYFVLFYICQLRKPSWNWSSSSTQCGATDFELDRGILHDNHFNFLDTLFAGFNFFYIDSFLCWFSKCPLRRWICLYRRMHVFLTTTT